MTRTRIAFLGFGEAGSAFARGFRTETHPVLLAYDIKIHDLEESRSFREHCVNLDVESTLTSMNAVIDSDATFSVVTAGQALAAAASIRTQLDRKPWYFDCNSCSPDTKRLAEQEISRLGGRYIDVAVMAPVLPCLHRTPLLVSGADADAAVEFMQSIGMNAAAVGMEVGEASAIKLVRSIFVKGLEATTMECALAARRAGVDDRVFRSLSSSYPELDWEAFAGRVIERMLVHGCRRAEEMEAAEELVRSLNLPSSMSAGAAVWQKAVGSLGSGGESGKLGRQLDRILASLDRK